MSESTDMELIVLLSQQGDNFPSLRGFIAGLNLRPSGVLLPETVKKVDATFNYQPSLVAEAIDYLDMVKFYSIVLYGDSNVLIDKVIKSIGETRSVESFSKTLISDGLNPYIFKTKEDALNFLENNKVFIAIYICSMVDMLMFQQN